MNNFAEKYPNTYFAMEALALAAMEEMDSAEGFQATALTAISGIAMVLVMKMNNFEGEFSFNEASKTIDMLANALAKNLHALGEMTEAPNETHTK